MGPPSQNEVNKRHKKVPSLLKQNEKNKNLR